MTVEPLLARFYAAFARRDAETMAACYAPMAQFRDPIFDLPNGEAPMMWRMLLSRGGDFALDYQILADEGSPEPRASWQARYTYSGTGRKVVNHIESRFVIENGLIVRQSDSFNLYRWATQALGMPGVLLGWTPLLQNKVRAKARSQLDRYIAARGAATLP